MNVGEEDLDRQRKVAQEFCSQNLTQCCDEMVEWSASGVLRNGKVRELVALCAFAGSHNALNVAEAMVRHEALVRAARPAPVQAPAVRDLIAQHGVERVVEAATSVLGGGTAAQPWDDLKVAFSIEDQEKFTRWATKTRAFYSDGTAGFPTGWELVELNGAGAGCVAVFRVEGQFRPHDGATVAKLLSTVGGYPYDAAPAAKNDKSSPLL